MEEGDVPLLMSLSQMYNFKMTLHLNEDNPYLESPVLGNATSPLRKPASRHLVFDVRLLTRAHPGKLPGDGKSGPSFFQQQEQGQSKVAADEMLGTKTQTVYKKRIGIAGHPCPACAGQHRAHTKIPPCKVAQA